MKKNPKEFKIDLRKCSTYSQQSFLTPKIQKQSTMSGPLIPKLSSKLSESDLSDQLLSVRRNLNESQVQSLERNLERLSLSKSFPFKTPPITSKNSHFRALPQNSFIDQFYPNSSRSKFTNRVICPGDYEYNKKMYADISRASILNVEVNKQKSKEDQENITEEAIAFYSRGIAAYTLMWKSFAGRGRIPLSTGEATLVNIQGSIYLYGGENQINFRGLYLLNPSKYQWSKCPDLSPFGKKGHSAVSYNRHMFVYGGWKFTNNSMTRKKMSQKVTILDTTSLTWNEVKGKSTVPTARRNHGISSLGQYMIIYGGVDYRGNTLNDVHVFNMRTYAWESPKFTYTQLPVGRSHTSLTAVFPKSVTSSSNPDLQSDNLYMDSGFYLFGGYSSKGEALNDLWVLKFTSKGCLWVKLCSKGAPQPRYSHTASYISEMIFYFGGCNSTDVFGLEVFLIKKQKWRHLKVVGKPPSKRFGHYAVVENRKILILGGQNFAKWCNNKIYVLETDQFVTQLARN